MMFVRIYPDSSFVIRILAQESGSVETRCVWQSILEQADVQVLCPSLVKKEVPEHIWNRFVTSRSVCTFIDAPFRSKWPTLKAGAVNPATGRTVKAGARHPDTHRPIRAGDSFDDQALTDLSRVFGMKGANRSGKRHRRDDDDIRHLIQAAEWQSDLFLTCEEKGKIWTLRQEIEATLAKYYAISLRIIRPDQLHELMERSS